MAFQCICKAQEQMRSSITEGIGRKAKMPQGRPGACTKDWDGVPWEVREKPGRKEWGQRSPEESMQGRRIWSGVLIALPNPFPFVPGHTPSPRVPACLAASRPCEGDLPNWGGGGGDVPLKCGGRSYSLTDSRTLGSWMSTKRRTDLSTWTPVQNGCRNRKRNFNRVISLDV